MCGNRGPACSGDSERHGMVGDRVFLNPIVGNDAFPDNALRPTMRRSDYQFSLLPEFEKQLSDTSSVLLNISWDELEPQKKSDVVGLTDLTIYFRQALLTSDPHELELTVSPFVVVLNGNRQIGDQRYTHLGANCHSARALEIYPRQPPSSISDRSRSRLRAG
jgi:hypothetical protein